MSPQPQSELDATAPGEAHAQTAVAERLHLLYHEIRAAETTYTYVLSVDQFQQHLNLFDRLLQERTSPAPEITFDDGHLSDYTEALPALASRGLRARFFITAGWTGTAGYLNAGQLRELHFAGQSIGAHGLTHTLLTHCDKATLHRELSESKRILEDIVGAPITTMSLPGGRSNGRVLQACREAGYTAVYTSFPRAERSPFGETIGRVNLHRDMTVEWIAALFQPGSSVLAGLGRRERVKQAARSLLGDDHYARLWRSLNREEARDEQLVPGGPR